MTPEPGATERASAAIKRAWTIPIPVLTLLLAVGLAVAGCGSERKVGAITAPTTPAIAASKTITRPVALIYGVSQVESAFAGHGITLRKAERRPERNVIVLVARHGVRVFVDVGPGNFSVGWTGERPIGKGNVTVFRGAVSRSTVEAALRQLR